MQQNKSNSKPKQFIPQVASASKTGKYLTIILMAIVAVILGRGFFTTSNYPSKKAASSPPVQVADNQAIPLNLNLELDQLTPPPPVIPTPAVIQPPPSVLPEPNVHLEQQHAQADDARIKSPSLVYGAKENAPLSRTTAENLPGADVNNLFAQQAANATVVTVSAKRNTYTDYKILQGKLISAVLETAVNSDLPGMVRAVINKDVYSDTGKYILLPRGTRLIGQYNSTVAVGQTRVMIMWTRAITPNHIDIALGSPSADLLGQSGMSGTVDSHFWKIFGTSTLLSILGVGASSTSVGDSNGQLGVYGNPYQVAITQGMLNASNNILQARINIQPTIRIPQGLPIQVFVARDLDFSTVRIRGY